MKPTELNIGEKMQQNAVSASVNFSKKQTQQLRTILSRKCHCVCQTRHSDTCVHRVTVTATKQNRFVTVS